MDKIELISYPSTKQLKRCINTYLEYFLGDSYDDSKLSVVVNGSESYVLGHGSPTGYILISYFTDICSFSFKISTAPGCCGILSIFGMRPVIKKSFPEFEKFLNLLGQSLKSGLMTYVTADNQRDLVSYLRKYKFRTSVKFINPRTKRELTTWTKRLG